MDEGKSISSYPARRWRLLVADFMVTAVSSVAKGRSSVQAVERCPREGTEQVLYLQLGGIKVPHSESCTMHMPEVTLA